jgi:hypothetical protein
MDRWARYRFFALRLNNNPGLFNLLEDNPTPSEFTTTTQVLKYIHVLERFPK